MIKTTKAVKITEDNRSLIKETVFLVTEIIAIKKNFKEGKITLVLTDYKGSYNEDQVLIKEHIETKGFDIPLLDYNTGVTAMGALTSFEDEVSKMYTALLADYNASSPRNTNAVWEMM